MLTPEQLGFTQEVADFVAQGKQALKESRELRLRTQVLIKRFEKAEKIIRELAKLHHLD